MVGKRIVRPSLVGYRPAPSGQVRHWSSAPHSRRTPRGGTSVPRCVDTRILVERNNGRKTETAFQKRPVRARRCRCRYQTAARPGPTRPCQRQRLRRADPTCPQVGPTDSGYARPDRNRRLSMSPPASSTPAILHAVCPGMGAVAVQEARRWSEPCHDARGGRCT
jgi:hypothetical protein